MQRNNPLNRCQMAVLLLIIACGFHPSYSVQRDVGDKGKQVIPAVSSVHTARHRTPHRLSLQQRYERAVEDARIAEPSEISKNLTAIVATNTKLLWDGAPGQSHILVVTWTSWSGYDQNINRPMTLTQDVWVTVVPELKDFCQHRIRNRKYLSLRLRELLGLPPNDTKTKFVELWVDPIDLFRPSPDPEINDHEAELDFPKSRFVSISEEYIKWFEDLRSKSYGENGYPWTRLGYTYDWGNPKSRVGLSEFVIRTGATVIVRSVSTTLDYCRRTRAH